MSELGIIEGFYGEPWGWPRRTAALGFLKQYGFDYFIYAPKADRRLRKEWRQPHEREDLAAMRAFGRACKDAQIEWGLGFTPLSLHEAWDGAGREDLSRRLTGLRELELDRLAILFDDMPGDFPELARTQAEILDFVADHEVAPRLSMCPTYYSDAGILDRLFGTRPDGYLGQLGEALAPDVEVCWTGPEICSKHYPLDHLQSVAERLGRKPLIWDNYPVNDGPRMCKHLHLRAPERPADMFDAVSGVMINPMNQAQLSRIALAAMSRSLRGESEDEASARTAEAIRLVLPEALAAALIDDAHRFQDEGLEAIPDSDKAVFIERYAKFEHPAAQELVDWLEGKTVVSKDILTDV